MEAEDSSNTAIVIPPIAEPGYWLPKEAVDRYYLWVERWGIPPEVLDRQDKRIIKDIEMRAALKSEAQREYWQRKTAENDGSGQLPEGWS